MPLPYLACMIAVAVYDALPPRVLPAIQAVEGGGPGVVHRNTDGSEDLGVMQVNTVWLQPLARYTGLATGAVRARLLAEPCFNIAAAGAILRTYLHETGGELMRAIGDYHSHTAPLNAAYQLRVRAAAAVMFGPTRS